MPNQDWWIVFKTKKEGNGEKELSNNLKDVKQGLVGAIEGFTGLSMGSLTLAGAIAGVGAVMKESVDFTLKYAEQVRDLSRVTGASAEETSRLVQVADDLKVDYGTLTQAAKALAKDGIALTTEALANASDEYLAFGTAGERAQFATEKFGKAGLELTKILEQGGDAIRGMAAEQNGSLILTDDVLKKTRDYEKAQDSLSDTLDGFKVVVGTAVIPLLAGIVSGMTDAITATDQLKNAFTSTAKNIATGAMTVDEFKKKIKDAGYEFSNAGDIIVQDGEYMGRALYRVVVPAKDVEKALKDVQDQAFETDRKAKGLAVTQYYLAKSSDAVATSTQNAGAMYSEMAKAYNEESILKAKEDMDMVTGSMTRLTTAALFQKAALSMDAEAALALGVSLGVVDQASYDANVQVQEWQRQLKDGEIDQQRYNQLIGDFSRSWNSVNSKDITMNVTTAYKTTGLMPGQQPVINPNLPVERFASGGSYTVPAGYYENYPVGIGKYASSGETVTISPAGQGGGGGITFSGPVYMRSDADVELLARKITEYQRRGRM